MKCCFLSRWTETTAEDAAEKLYQKGDMRELCDFVENRYFKVFSNRDYRWANELTVKTAFLNASLQRYFVYHGFRKRD
jgi:hypothetical protein